ncbi:mitogen-activated protein kinase hog1 [Aspergillus lentulus]|uniref:Mitogen-activated protein kinase hog1 n=1 Tax=Aspergillus lentulus TaxID=293939 RepID=A0ABQ0ZWL0_ASPLE|nr:mitogen-activated protein kinase hog1 [Aspergillus lentulus]GFF26527.1 mitogen-activated protein kinase hog1 [Aspergillus lentulus]GFF47459.1 mitogen-activated protein kinase hog1 [Aspergillus lentulus]GFF67154.1 mitogen-activated protein kinase hog1 [Aspergillus lentulus]GFF80125.1 mitogen-activated protein kinase hog1 [Aspergillus lentulus]GFG06653.1 mitogen-activated protein kinase hog1 [Aspergillus lentulus]
MAGVRGRQAPIVMVIDFHHARGPEIELCIGEEDIDIVTKNDWSLLPFMALSDGAHASTEEFSYFTLRKQETETAPATSLFGIACSRQLDSNLLINRPADVTRSTVQKAVVVITDTPQSVGQLREKLSVVTSAWFAQRDFSDIDILKKFREGLIISWEQNKASKDQNLGLSLREMIHEFKYQTLVLFKALLLQPKMLFFGSRCERLCMIQFSLISLIPGLINSLQDCADPAADSYAQTVGKPTSLKTSDRASLLAYMGLPLQIFGKGSMFGPYTPLQQLDLLADHGTKSYVVGSTNSLLLQQKDRYSDILINLDEDVITISSPSLRSSLVLSAADRRWIDLLTQIINDTWDESHPQRPKDHGYMGSEEFIRLQFEEYLLALLASMKYHEELHSFSSGESGQRSRAQLEAYNIEGDPALDFNPDFLAHWQTTSNYALFKRLTSDALLFSIVEPRHPCAGGLTIEDVQRRLSQQVAELHLDERVREGREALNRHLATGQKKVSAAFNSFWADIEAMREAQRKRNEERASQSQRSSMDQPRPSLDTASVTSATGSWFGGRKAPAVDIAQAQASVNAVSQKAGAYLSSWSSWASEKRKEWQEKKATPSSPSSVTSPSTPTLSSIVEGDDSERGRRRSMQQRRQSEDSATLSRSRSRRKRWSNILLRRESGDFGLPNAKEDGSPDGSEQGQPYPKSPLSRGTSARGDDVAQSTQPKNSDPSTQPPVEKEPETSTITDIVEKQQPADEKLAEESASHPSGDKAPAASAEHAPPSTSASNSN